MSRTKLSRPIRRSDKSSPRSSRVLTMSASRTRLAAVRRSTSASSCRKRSVGRATISRANVSAAVGSARGARSLPFLLVMAFAPLSLAFEPPLVFRPALPVRTHFAVVAIRAERPRAHGAGPRRVRSLAPTCPFSPQPADAPAIGRAALLAGAPGVEGLAAHVADGFLGQTLERRQLVQGQAQTAGAAALLRARLGGRARREGPAAAGTGFLGQRAMAVEPALALAFLRARLGGRVPPHHRPAADRAGLDRAGVPPPGQQRGQGRGVAGHFRGLAAAAILPFVSAPLGAAQR